VLGQARMPERVLHGGARPRAERALLPPKS
jgi:hypothetical protein